MVTDQATVGGWSHNPLGVLRFIEVGEEISKDNVHGNNNPIDQNVEGIHENEEEDQPVDDSSVLDNTAPTGGAVTMSSGRVS